jgi:plastocyanin
MKCLPRTIAAALFAAALAVPAFAQVHNVAAPCCAFQDPLNGNSNVSIVPVGTTVQWTRVGITPHTVTSGTGPADPTSGSLFNGSLAGATTTFTHAFPSLGTFAYYCTFHTTAFQSMTGTVHVLPPATATAVGTGCPSSAGVPVLGTNSLPKVGNATFAFTLSGGPAGAPAYLFLAASTGPPVAVSPFCNALLDLVSLNAFIQAGVTPTPPQALGPGGTTAFTFFIPNSPGLGGLTGAAQALILDGGAPGGFALSNAVSVVVGA